MQGGPVGVRESRVFMYESFMCDFEVDSPTCTAVRMLCMLCVCTINDVRQRAITYQKLYHLIVRLSALRPGRSFE